MSIYQFNFIFLGARYSIKLPPVSFGQLVKCCLTRVHFSAENSFFFFFFFLKSHQCPLGSRALGKDYRANDLFGR